MNKRTAKIWVFALVLCVAASFYPFLMGIRVISGMIADGSVIAENYPKYLIPYTPISLAVVFGTAVLPFSARLFKKRAFAFSAIFSIFLFFCAEFLLERLVIITETAETTLERWQMYMCYAAPSSYTTKIYSAGEMLIGDYSPAFKLHFYIISVILILSILGCVYGFADETSVNRTRKKALALQTVSTVLFLGLCILACFTAFWRTGELLVSPLSATLMILFFVLFGLVSGFFHASFAVGKRTLFSKILPCISSAAAVLVMYIGELILLDGKLYRYGTGTFFEPMGIIPFSLCDITAIAAAFLLCFLALWAIDGKKLENKEEKK